MLCKATYAYVYTKSIRSDYMTHCTSLRICFAVISGSAKLTADPVTLAGTITADSVTLAGL